MDEPVGAAAQPRLPSLPRETLEHIARQIESHADALSFALASKATLDLVETTTEHLGKFSTSGSEAEAAVFQAMNRSRIRELAIRPSAHYGPCGGLRAVGPVQRAVAACPNLDVLTVNAWDVFLGGPWTWPGAVRHLRRLQLSRACSWTAEEVVRCLHALPLEAIVIECRLERPHRVTWPVDAPRAHPTMRTIVLAHERGDSHAVRGTLEQAVGPRLRTAVVAVGIEPATLSLIGSGSSVLKTLVIRSSNPLPQTQLLTELGRYVAELTTLGVMLDYTPLGMDVRPIASALPRAARLIVWAPSEYADSPLRSPLEAIGPAQRLTFVIRSDTLTNTAAGTSLAEALKAAMTADGRITVADSLAELVRSIVDAQDYGPRPRIGAADTASA